MNTIIVFVGFAFCTRISCEEIKAVEPANAIGSLYAEPNLPLNMIKLTCQSELKPVPTIVNGNGDEKDKGPEVTSDHKFITYCKKPGDINFVPRHDPLPANESYVFENKRDENGMQCYCIYENKVQFCRDDPNDIRCESFGPVKPYFILKVKLLPEPPDGLRVVATSESTVALEWEPIKYDDLGTAIDITIQMRQLGHEWVNVTTLPNTTTSYLMENLTPKTYYQFRAYTSNEVGFSNLSHTTKYAYTNYTEPKKPTDVMVIHDTMREYVTWTIPWAHPNASIIKYIIEVKQEDGEWKTHGEVKDGTKNTIDIFMLKRGVNLQFRVRAVNEFGISEVSDPSEVTKLAVRPGKPEIVSAVKSGRQTATITWILEDNGGANITQFIFEIKSIPKGGWTHWAVMVVTPDQSTDGTLTFEVENLPKGEFQFRVIAENLVNKSDPSEPSKDFVISEGPPTQPEPPTEVEATAVGRQNATITWGPPDDDGGSTVTHYIIQMRPKGKNWENATEVLAEITSVTLQNLPKGEIEFRVIAVNKVGQSTPKLAKEPVQLEGQTKPGPPTDVAVEVLGRQNASVTWKAPGDDGESPLLEYIVQWKEEGGKWQTGAKVPASNTSAIVENLPKGKIEFQVIAVNKIAPSDPSQASKANEFDGPPTKSEPPTGVVATVLGRQNASVTWTAPDDDGGSALIEYIVQWKEEGGKWQTGAKVPASNTTAIVENLPKGKLEFQVIAVNNVSKSDPSKPSEAVEFLGPPTKSTAPTGVTAEVLGRQNASVSWTAPDDDGGSELLEYIVQWKEEGGEWQTGAKVPASDTSAIVENLPKGKIEFQVIAANNVSNSDPSEASEAVEFLGPPTKAQPPTDVVATVLDRQKGSVTWTPPEDDGGSKITGYIILWRVEGGEWEHGTKVSAKRTTAEVGNLKRGVIEFVVIAINAVGESDPSKPSIRVEFEGPPRNPDPPTNVNSIKNDRQDATVSWIAPLIDHGSAVVSYRVQYQVGENGEWQESDVQVFAPRLTAKIGNLPKGDIRFRVIATNGVGDSEPSKETGFVEFEGPPTGPDPPTSVQAKKLPTSRQIAYVTWRQPAKDNGSPITGYRIEYQLEDGEWVKSDVEIISEKSSSAQVPDLPKGKIKFRVIAINAAGESEPSEPSEGVEFEGPPTKPDPPTDVVATKHDRQTALVKWKAPANDNGSPVIYYKIEIRQKGGEWEKTDYNITAKNNQARIDNLPSGDLEFRVIAVNAVGESESEPSEPVNFEGPPTAPDPPIEVVAVKEGRQSATVTWNPPLNDNGSPITGYRVEMKVGDQEWEDTGERLSAKITSANIGQLPKGKIVFRVIAINKVGRSIPSNASEAVDFEGDPTPPDPPIDVKADVLGRQEVNVSWSAPLNDNGSPVTHYYLEMKPEGGKWERLEPKVSYKTTWAKRTNLPKGEIEFRVIAVNEKGDSIPSNVTIVTLLGPPTPPEPPTDVEAEKVNRQEAKVTWKPPLEDNGSPVTGYALEMQVGDDGKWQSVDAKVTGTTASVRKLPKGVIRFRVIAINAKGNSTASNASNPVEFEGPPTKPDPPTDVTAVADGRQKALVNWKAPLNDNGSPVTGYLIEIRVGDGKWQAVEAKVNVDGTSAVVENLPQGVIEFRVIAVNKIGQSDPSEPSEGVEFKGPPTKPFPPINVKAVVEGRQVANVSWEPPEDDGGAPIQDYRIEMKLEGSTEWQRVEFKDKIKTKISALPKNLPRGNMTFRVIAINRIGESDPSNESNIVELEGPPTKPDPPTNVQVNVEGRQNATLTWNPPLKDNGAPVTDFIIKMKPENATEWQETYAKINGTSAFVKGIPKGNVTFIVIAVNKEGNSDASEPSPSVEFEGPPTKPDPPSNVQVNMEGRQNATLTWDPPLKDNGAPVTDFIIKMKPENETEWQDAYAKINGTSAFVKGIPKGNVTFIVIAVNSEGNSDPSEPSASVEFQGPPAKRMVLLGAAYPEPGIYREQGLGATIGVLIGKPDPPTGVKAVVDGRQKAQVSWVPPVNDNGSPITYYIIQIKHEDGTWHEPNPQVHTEKTSAVVENLERGVTEFRVIAVNKFDKSDPSEPSEGVEFEGPPRAPEPPLNLTCVKDGRQSATLTWEPPAIDNGAPVKGYRIEMKPEGGTWQKANTKEIPGKKTAAVVKDLPAGVVEFRVIAINAKGESNASNVVSETFEGPPGGPDPPTNVTVVKDGRQTANISWVAPENDNGSPVTEFHILMKPERGQWTKTNVKAGPGETSATIENLPKGKIEFAVIAVNKFGPSVASEPTEFVEFEGPPLVPDPPSDVKAVPIDNTTATVSWSAPKEDNGSPITYYKIQKRCGNGPWENTGKQVSGEELTADVKGLQPGKCEFRVIAISKIGASNFSRPFRVTMPGPPDAPNGVVAKETNNMTVSLTWNSPAYDGGSNITGFIIEQRPLDGKWEDSGVRVDANVNHAEISGVSTDTHQFRVVAENIYGRSPPSKGTKYTEKTDYSWARKLGILAGIVVLGIFLGLCILKMITRGRRESTDSYIMEPVVEHTREEEEFPHLIGTPGPPTDLKVVKISPNSYDITWGPPADDGGSPIAYYVVEKKLEGGEWEATGIQVPAGSATSATVKELPQGNHQFRVIAFNKKTKSAPSGPKTGTSIGPSTKPDAPLNASAQAVDSTTVEVSWSPPAYSGRTPVTHYIVEKQSKGGEWASAIQVRHNVTSTQVKNLPKGDFQFRVRAGNKFAVSDPSNVSARVSVEGPPATDPDAPTNVRATKVNEDTAQVTWEPPENDGGSPITLYVIEQKSKYGEWEDSGVEVSGAMTTAKLSNLKEDYRFRVTAVNKVGQSGPSKPSDIVALSGPSRGPDDQVPPPKNVRVRQIEEDIVDVTWTAPEVDSEFPIIRYHIEMQSEDGDWQDSGIVVPGNETSTTMKNLRGKYRFRVRAVNENNRSDPSEPSAKVTLVGAARAPDRPISVNATKAGPKSVKISWDPPAFDGGAEITHYIVEIKTEDGDWTDTGNRVTDEENFTVIEDLEKGYHQFRVLAVNKAGRSDPSHATKTIIILE